MNTRTILCAASSLCVIASLSGSARAERFIDTFAAPLPQQVLPGTSSPAPVLWTGTENGGARWQDHASQSGLSGVIGGARDTTLMASTVGNLVTLSSTQASGKRALSYATGYGGSGRLLLEYGADRDLNANLSGDGSVAFELEIAGDMDDALPHRPVALTVTVASGGAPPRAAHATLTEDGVYQIPFASFPGVNFADVDYVSLDFDASQVSAVDYTLLGGIRTTRCIQPSGSAVADIVLDAFSAPLPLRAIPGAGQFPILWAGTLNGTVKPSDTASQSSLFGAIGGQRETRVVASSLSNFITATMSEANGTPELSYATGTTTSGTLRLTYGAQAPLNADLSPAVAFELELDGDLDSSPPRPVPLTVTVVSGLTSRSATVTLVNDGMVYVPFSRFPQIDFRDVDRVTLLFNASQVEAVDFSLIGGVRAAACVP
ncbi:hypothetical protein [Sorangium sp. So ce1000]|uniref:hypothetical protein n=1 Tax=Sorangium sp. So ce1000 TaxID=3133325 RepID=UPI003F63D2E8